MRIGINKDRWLGIQYSKGDYPYILEMENNSDVRGLRRKVVLMPIGWYPKYGGDDSCLDSLEFVVYLIRIERSRIDPVDTCRSIPM